MRVIAIGDLHGRDVWKQVDVAGADRVIFLGDYTDSRQGFTDEEIYRNLAEILKLKAKNPDKITLLIGNHDAQYLHFPNYRCSGFRPAAQPELTRLFNDHQDFFQMAYQKGNYLFTHAGVSNGWYQHCKPYIDQLGIQSAPVADQLNALHTNRQTTDLLFEVGPIRGGGDLYGGPVWADRTETIHNNLTGYHQVVGHTPIAEITTYGDERSSITYCDVTQLTATFFDRML